MAATPTPGRLRPLRRLLRAAMLDACAAADIDPRLFGWQNRPTAPPADGRSWGVETVRPGIEGIVGAGFPRLLEADGVYVVTLDVPAREGGELSDALAEAVEVAFRPGHRLTASVQRTDAARLAVECRTSEVSPSVQGLTPNWSRCAVSVAFRTRRLVARDGTPVPFAPPPLLAA